MYYTYVLVSTTNPVQRYIGYTSNLKSRLEKHNNGEVSHTSKYRPWKLLTYIAFLDRGLATGFERYLKSSSGKAFMNKRLITISPSHE